MIWHKSKQINDNCMLCVAVTNHVIIIIIIDHFNIALFSAFEQTHCAHVASCSKWVTILFYSSCFYFIFIFLFCLNIHRSGVLTAIFGCYTAGATWNCCRLGASSVYTIQPCTSSQWHFIQFCSSVSFSFLRFCPM